jgi:sugar phosphate isomerase/epimerase
MTKKHAIKRCVSFYSFQDEYFLRKMTLEDILATCPELDIPGIEIIGDQMIPGYPEVEESFFDQWYGWMEEYGLTPVCLDLFLDTNKYKDRVMTEEEKAETVIKDIKFANRLGCTLVRMGPQIQPELMERLAPHAETHEVKLGIEIHSPQHFDHAFQQNHLEVFEKTQSPYLGFVLDMGIYTKRIPRVLSDRWIRDGVKPEIVNHMLEVYDSQSGIDTLNEDLLKMGATPGDIAIANFVFLHYAIYTDPRRILDYMPWVLHVHAKFYEMLPDYTEYSIPYEEVIQVLIEGGYKGYLSSEYEGNGHIQDAFDVDSVEQVRRQQVMFKRLLGKE